MSVAVREMSEGELQSKSTQIRHHRRYLLRNHPSKPASLIAACCSIGACSVAPDDAAMVEKMRKFESLSEWHFK